MAFANQFKRSMKSWVKDHPGAKEDEFMDFCESIIPPESYTAHYWLLDQARDWYKHVLSIRKSQENSSLLEEDGMI